MNRRYATVRAASTLSARKAWLVVTSFVAAAGMVALAATEPQAAVARAVTSGPESPALADRVEFRREVLRRRLADRPTRMPGGYEAGPLPLAGVLTSPSPAARTGVEPAPSLGEPAKAR